jgi:hypothetical protein
MSADLTTLGLTGKDTPLFFIITANKSYAQSSSAQSITAATNTSHTSTSPPATYHSYPIYILSPPEP